MSLSPSTPQSGLLSGYAVSGGVFNEMSPAPGILRPHWQKFTETLDRLGASGLAECSGQARRAMADNGVTYNVYGDPQGMDRPWEFDPVPLIIPPEEWSALETALIQRTRLLNLLLADIYGPQSLLKNGQIPPALVLGNPGYQFACQGLKVRGNTWLHLHAVDLARGPDGKWWALGDRTQTPTGAGYALENRIVLSRILPDELRDQHVQRLAGFFRTFRENLASLAPHSSPGSAPHIVLLTPGPHNETYFEHAYLARYLGFPLVDGGDLTVRDRRVFVKTLAGLQPVDVILRRVDDSYCDPLELRQVSFLGVPGLLEAARAGNITIANALGAGLAESPGLLAFLPALSRRLLSEELKLPSLATWWCGQKREREYVASHLDHLVIKGALAERFKNPFFGSSLTDPQKAEVLARIRERPHGLLGQEMIALSKAPVWTGTGLEARPVALRVFIAAAGDSAVVMPGGLTRVSVSPNIPIVSMQGGGGSKDTWVLATGPVRHRSLLTQSARIEPTERIDRGLPSRLADSLYWMGRYAERAEGTVRLMRGIISRIADQISGDSTAECAALLRLLTPMELVAQPFPEPFSGPVLTKGFREILFGTARPGSLRAVLNSLRGTAWTVRDRLSLDTWRILTELHQHLPSERARPGLNDMLELLNRMILDLSGFSGMAMESMTRGHGWRFLEIGRRVERASGLLMLLTAALNEDPEGHLVLEPLLEIGDSIMTYRRRYFSEAKTAPVLDLLLLDAQNPRGLSFQFASIHQQLHLLPAQPDRPFPGPEHELVSALRASLRELNPGTPAAILTETLHDIFRRVGELSNMIAAVYFSHVEARIS